MRVLTLTEIQSLLDLKKTIAMQEEGFKLYSEGKVTVPPVGYMKMGPGFGEVHVKYGWISGDPLFVVKIAGAYPCSEPSIQGVLLVFDAQTGTPIAILQDQGYLTSLRTAIAGLIAAKFLAPNTITGIGILGTGVQARLQAELLKYHSPCRNLWVWGRNDKKTQEYLADMTHKGFQVKQAASPEEICQRCNLIVTATSAREPLIRAEHIRQGTHITALGADAPGKQELDPNIFRLADLCAVDSISQCVDHGETFHPYKAGILSAEHLVEIGTLISGCRKGRQSDDQITIADLTGVGVQDIQIAKSILNQPYRCELFEETRNIFR